jgi:pantoate--beta-alanine ligase
MSSIIASPRPFLWRRHAPVKLQTLMRARDEEQEQKPMRFSALWRNRLADSGARGPHGMNVAIRQARVCGIGRRRERKSRRRERTGAGIFSSARRQTALGSAAETDQGVSKGHMGHRLQVARSIVALERALTRLKRSGKIALVPTMGALHKGHLALVRQARRRAPRVIVSIFVNPTQFAPHEDFASYPRTFDRDLSALASFDVDLVWAPTTEVMYPQGFATRVVPDGAAAAGLEDKFRPHFFTGVATVVSKLFIQCRPDIAIFGEKDYQQLKVVSRMARDLDLPVRVIGVPTVREHDGLALSSRNVYLSREERTVAPTLYRTLIDCADKISAGREIAATLADGRRTIESVGFALDYLEARHAETLAPVASLADGPIRLLVAARLGKTRLIDNVAV